MKKIFFVLLSCICFQLLLSGSIVCGQLSQKSVPQGKLVLRLPYRGPSATPLRNPYLTALYEANTFTLIGRTFCTDSQGRLYVADPTVPGQMILKQFDKQGRFISAWSPLDAPGPANVTVTRGGYVWVGTAETSDRSGTPLVIYQTTKKQPIANWRFKTPDAIEQRLKRALDEQGLKQVKNNANRWFLTGLGSGGNCVWLALSGRVDKGGQRMESFVWMLMNEQGSRVLDVRVVVPSLVPIEKTVVPRLTPKGNPYYTRSNLNIKTLKWNHMWIRNDEQSKVPFQIDLTQLLNAKSGWQKKLKLASKTAPPYNFVDGVGNNYLVWTRDAQQPHRLFRIGRETLDMPPMPWGDGEKALVVLDKKGRELVTVPWTPTYFESLETWIIPLPDGSGFYRTEFAEKEARIYFHPLPK